MPDSNPGGSGNYNPDETLSNIVNPNQVISDPEFQNFVETLVEPDVEEESRPTEAWTPTPLTWKLTKKAVKANSATTKIISSTEFNDWESEDRTIKIRELRKTVFAKRYKAGVVPVENLVQCPVQADPTKHQRNKYGLIIDQSVDDMTVKLLDLTRSRKPNRVKIQLPMSFYDSERAVGYMDLQYFSINLLTLRLFNLILTVTYKNGEVTTVRKLTSNIISRAKSIDFYENLGL